MFNVLYLHRRDNFDTLKYSLRSVEKYVTYDEVYIVGDKPEWAVNVNHIECEHLEDRFEDVNNKMRLALEEIPFMAPVLLMHDDIFLLEPYKERSYYNGLLRDANVGGRRKEVFNNTMQYVDDDCKNYGLHYPMPFLNTLEWDFDKPVSYMNILGEWYVCKDVETEDCKFKNPQGKIDDLPCFSTHSEGEHLLPLLEELYPNKSQFEK